MSGFLVKVSGPPASESIAGVVEIATTAETATGTDAVRAVTPKSLHDMTTLSGAAWLLDEDAMSSDSAVLVASQQSVKAYVDTQVAAITAANLVSSQGFTATGTWTRPTDVINIIVEIWGNGGGGGGGGASLNGSNGGTGGACSFGAHCSVTGGLGGGGGEGQADATLLRLAGFSGADGTAADGDVSVSGGGAGGGKGGTYSGSGGGTGCYGGKGGSGGYTCKYIDVSAIETVALTIGAVGTGGAGGSGASAGAVGMAASIVVWEFK
jgi:hypothetical protein